ncbi:MAG: hypothetical protein C0481_03645 [Phenylobacterium sp.]|uniref:protein NO VEIN domain-containing protein n=1 Tax=Phenylobacterium sp. TaxID=1871053 RepID=UPI0025DDE0D7|nr:DUF3883 domain-containing protein [Phenylobacterium sp.]MBA4010937.1 hypothetical protein [Phenylobacterium sp.]
MPLVLVHNDVVTNPAHAWDDVEGVHYHYPSKYQGKITTGEPFVYYRGVHRLGGKRGPAEYVGFGRVGTIWLDPKTQESSRKAWYCAIEGYQRFETPVPAKVDGVNLEDIPANLWRDGVRTLEPAVYQRIMELSGGRVLTATANPPESASIVIARSDNLVVPVATSGPTRARSSYRRSKQAKVIGDWAEAVALRHIKAEHPGSTAHFHRAAMGETPGWDIDFRDEGGTLQRVEVKGTTGGGFTGIEVTAGELRSARTHRQGYWLYLVAGCLTASPKVQIIQDPVSYIETSAWAATPAVYSVRFQGQP